MQDRGTSQRSPPPVSFFGQFLRDWKTVGAVAPTSPFARRALIAAVDFSRARVVVELGPGTGSITRGILRRLSPDAKLIAVEISEDFCQALRRRFTDPRVVIEQDSATNLPAILQRNGFVHADAIICSIPFANLDEGLRNEILEAARKGLGPGGVMTALQYTPLVMPRLMRRHFGGYRTRFCLLNVPPALIYEASVNH